MKPFDLERALAGDPVVTRDGRKVDEIVLLQKALNTDYCLIVVIAGYLCAYFATGSKGRSELARPSDLFMDTVKKTLYQNIFKNENGDGYWSGKLCDTKEETNKRLLENSSLRNQFIKVAEIEIEE